MLRKLGVVSFSEPFWLDNIATLPSHGMDHDMIGRVSDNRRRPLLSLPGMFDDGTGLMAVLMLWPY